MMNSSGIFPIEKFIDLDYPSGAQLSPDGLYLAYILGKGHKPDQNTLPPKAIYIVEVESHITRQVITSETNTDDQPLWSPDSHHIAWLSNRASPAEMQLYIADVNGGEPQALTDLLGGVEAHKWSPDGCWISFLYKGTLNQEISNHPDPDPIVMDENPRFNHVWLVNTETHEIRAATSENCHVFEYVWSPDSKKLVALMSSHPNPAEGWYAAQLFVIDLATGKTYPLCEMPHQLGRLTWSPDGASIAFVAGIMSDEGNISGEIYVVPAAGGEARCITPGIDHSITWIEWHNNTNIIVYGGRQIDSAVIGWVEPDTGKQRIVSKGTYTINGQDEQRISLARNGQFVALRESFTELPNIYLGSLNGGDWKPLTDFHQEHFPPLHVENRHWQHPDGTVVHGFLVYPPDYVPGKRYPLFVHIHGGPSWGYVPRYLSGWERLIVSRGCLVLMPNPRGSWGRGYAYQTANVGDLGGGDWQDINAGIDPLIAEGLADPDRLAIGGWSYGGYLTTWAVTQTDRFRCAIAGASITSYESNYGVVSNREWQTTMFGSNVYDDYELHRSRSPIAYASRVKTPTLLVHGEQDRLAPVQQAIEFYTALKHFGIPTRLVIYPREPHGFQER
ncbi:MAG TPA: S9 family peptidase, partial [Phototrophicaceae bacterium]|nr:S9 family peptidase [Phototrophicaceae bacterium]